MPCRALSTGYSYPDNIKNYIYISDIRRIFRNFVGKSAKMAKNNQTLAQRQQQLLRLNQRQMLLGRLVEMSAAEFEEEIVRAMEENPAIACVDDDAYDADTDDGRTEPSRDDSSDNSDDDYYEPRLVGATTARRFTQHPESSTEADSVEQQLDEMHLAPLDREIAHYIISSLDSSGYLTRSADDIADDMALTDGIEVDTADVERMIAVVKQLDPPGIGASNLRECLLIQLRHLRPSPAVKRAATIIDRYYKHFAANHLEEVRDAIKADDNAFAEALAVIKSLNPKPGAALFDPDTDDRGRHISPDFIVDYDDRDRPWITLATNTPDLVVAPAFRVDAVRTADPKAAEFIKERRDGASDFIEAVKSRDTTLLTIMQAIVALQPEYFRSFEPADLRPMVIRDVERLTGLDKSVISRATSTKYMLTPEGICPVKTLFSESASVNGFVSAREVEEAIRQAVDDEDKTTPLNDDELTAALAAKGLNVARRTVAKYRERIGIPVARLRRSISPAKP